MTECCMLGQTSNKLVNHQITMSKLKEIFFIFFFFLKSN